VFYTPTIYRSYILRNMKVLVEFCTAWGYDKRYKALATKLQSSIPDLQVQGNVKPPRSSAFEITTEDGSVLWSKLGGQGFPDENALNVIIGKLKDAKS